MSLPAPVPREGGATPCRLPAQSFAATPGLASPQGPRASPTCQERDLEEIVLSPSMRRHPSTLVEDGPEQQGLRARMDRERGGPHPSLRVSDQLPSPWDTGPWSLLRDDLCIFWTCGTW